MFLRRLAVVSAGLLVTACGGAPSAPAHGVGAGRVGASIAVLSDGRVAVVNPDEGSVSFLDPDTLKVKATIAVGGEPHALLQLDSGLLMVSTYRSGELALVDPARERVVGHRHVCAGPYGLSEAPSGAWAAVACEWSGSVLRVDPATLESYVLASGLSRPRAVVALKDSVVVADYTGGSVHRVSLDGTMSSVSLVPTSAPYRPALTQMTANLAEALVPLDGSIYVAYELVNHTGNTSAEKVAEDYGSVVDGNPKINPAVGALSLGGGKLALSKAPVLYARFDGGARVFSDPAALAAAGQHRLLVAHLNTKNVALLDTRATSPDSRVIGSFQVAAGASGIAVDPARHFAYVDNAFDLSVSRIDLTQPRPRPLAVEQAGLTRIRTLASPYSADALAGRRIFYDATNPHITPSGVVSCGTCHPSGGDDGLVWFIHTPAIPVKRRRTPNLANAHTGMGPFHWSGEFSTMHDLVQRTIIDLMAGDALLVDEDQVRAFIDEMAKPPVPPPQDPAAVLRGKLLFDSSAVGCATCHVPPKFTDNKLHAVLNPMSLHSDDVISAAKTPGLRGVFLDAPYFHDGRSPNLRDLLTRSDAMNHGHTSGLTKAQLDDLIAYLKSL